MLAGYIAKPHAVLWTVVYFLNRLLDASSWSGRYQQGPHRAAPFRPKLRHAFYRSRLALSPLIPHLHSWYKTVLTCT